MQKLEEMIEKSLNHKKTVFLFVGDKGSTLLMDVMRDMDVKTVFIDTGCHFGETLEYVNSFGGEIETLKNNNTLIDNTNNPDECCKQRKNIILKAYLNKANAKNLIVPFIDEEKDYGVEKTYISGLKNIEIIKPLANYAERDIWVKIKKNHLQYSGLYNKGYRIVDCKCCITRFGRIRGVKDQKNGEFHKETEEKLRALGYM